MPEKKEQTKAITIREYMKTETALKGFVELMGESDARAYISNVLIAVENDEKLLNCEPKSIYISALRAASLKLSVDPIAKQAYLIPFGNKCTLQVHYKGLVDLAVRTEKYRYINVAPVYEGEMWVEDRLSGIHKLEGGKTSDKIIGWFASFEMLPEYVKTLYMSLEEIHDHAKQYSKSYNSPKSLWKTNPKVMERKTPLRILLTLWGYIALSDKVALMAVESEDWINGEFEEIEAEVAEKRAKPKKKKTAKQSAEELGFDMEPKVSKVNDKTEVWPKEALTVVKNVTSLKTDVEANQLLLVSGLDSTVASLSGIRQFAKWYQAGLDQEKSAKDALKYAKTNWQNNGGEEEK